MERFRKRTIKEDFISSMNSGNPYQNLQNKANLLHEELRQKPFDGFEGVYIFV